MRLLLLCLALSTASTMSAMEPCHHHVNLEKTLYTEDVIYLISTFKKCDKISAYTFQGLRIWELEFCAKITSWHVIHHELFVSSEHKHQTHVTCLNRFTGEILWQIP